MCFFIIISVLIIQYNKCKIHVVASTHLIITWTNFPNHKTSKRQKLIRLYALVVFVWCLLVWIIFISNFISAYLFPHPPSLCLALSTMQLYNNKAAAAATAAAIEPPHNHWNTTMMLLAYHQICIITSTNNIKPTINTCKTQV